MRDGETHVVLVGEDLERGLNDTTTETEDEVEGRLLLDVWELVFSLRRGLCGTLAAREMRRLGRGAQQRPTA
jgi:hypothetical protein